MELLALVAQIGHENLRAFIAANSAKGTKLPPPLDLTPKKKPKRQDTIGRLDAMLEAAR